MFLSAAFKALWDPDPPPVQPALVLPHHFGILSPPPWLCQEDGGGGCPFNTPSFWVHQIPFCSCLQAPLKWLLHWDGFLIFKKHLLITYWVPTFWVWGKGVEIFPVSQGTPCLVEETDH